MRLCLDSPRPLISTCVWTEGVLEWPEGVLGLACRAAGDARGREDQGLGSSVQAGLGQLRAVRVWLSIGHDP